MAKTKVTEAEVIEEAEADAEVAAAFAESPMEANRILTDFGRTDLNELRDAVNELYRR